MSFGETFASLSLLTTLVMSVLVGAICLQRTYFHRVSASERFLVQGLLSSALWLYPTLVLGFAGTLTLPLLLTVEVGAALLAYLLWRRAGRPGPDADRPWLSHPASVAAVATTLLCLSLGAWTALGKPPLAWDDLAYHLPKVAQWSQQHEFTWLYHPTMLYQGHYPGNVEAMALWAALPFHGDLLVGLTTLPFLALQGAAVHGLARRAGAPRGMAGLATVAYILTPVVSRLGGTLYTESVWIAGALAGLCVALDAAKSGARRDFVLVGLAAGLIAGSKVIGPVYALFALAPALFALRRAPFGVCLALVVSLPGAAWFIQLWVTTGNPVYPVPVLGLDGFAQADGGVLFYQRFFELADDGRLLAALLGANEPAVFELGLGPKLLGLSLLGVGALRTLTRSGTAAPAETLRARRYLAFCALCFLGIFAIVPANGATMIFHQVRFLAPALALLVALGFAWSSSRAPRLSFALALSCCASDLGAALFGLPDDWRWALGGLIAFVALAAAVTSWRHPEVARSLESDAGVDPAHPLLGEGFRAVVLGPATTPARRRALRGAVFLCGSAGVLLIGTAGLRALSQAREATRHMAYEHDWSLSFTVVQKYAPGWRFFDAHADADARVAVRGFDFVYPLYGPALRRAVVQVDIDARALGAYHRYPGGRHRDAPDVDAWLRNLARAGSEWLYLERAPWERSFPMERIWADERKDRFHLSFANGHTRIYRIGAAREL